ncbi:MAG: putative rane protein [Micrococcaceae bacterium]|jgi:hypothetical protein|nr:putative rane protein [Micrococcaceae bacterium]
MSSAQDVRNGPQAGAPAGSSSLVGLVRLLSRLAPKQLNDEISLAKAELKRKGIALGIAVAFLVVALLMLALMVISLLVAAIMGLATIMPAWLAALLVAALFLVILVIAALIGVQRLKKTMPLLPEEALLGIRSDIGVLREGRKFNPSSLRKPVTRNELEAQRAEKTAKAKRNKAAKEAKAAQQGPAPSEGQLKERTAARREHLLSLREQLAAQADFRKKAKILVAESRSVAAGATEAAREQFELARPGAEELAETAKERWVPLTVLAVSSTAFVVFLRKLLGK